MKLIYIGCKRSIECQTMKPRINDLLNIKPNLKIINYDYDDSPKLRDKYHIGKVLPVIIITNKNTEFTRLIGEHTIEELINAIDMYEKR